MKHAHSMVCGLQTPGHLHRSQHRQHLRPSHTHRAHLSSLRSAHGCTHCRATASPGPDMGFNPFRNQKEDQAKQALQKMFGDRPDSLAANDLPPGGRPPPKGPGGGGGSSSSGSGGSGGDEGNSRGLPELRAWLIGLFTSAQGFAKFAAAAAGIALALWVSPYVLPALDAARDAVGWAFRFLLRLNPRPPRQRQLAMSAEALAELGPSERSMIAKYG